MLLVFPCAAAAETGLPGAQAPLQPMRETTMVCVLYLQPMDNHHGAQIHTASHGEPQAAAGGDILREGAALGEPKHNQIPDRNCILCRESLTGAVFLVQTVPLED